MTTETAVKDVQLNRVPVRLPAGLLSLLLLLIAFISTAHAETHVSGEIYGNWDPSGNPWIVDSACVIPSGHTLDIEPGCEILIEWWGSPQIRVDGILNAVGTTADSITVTAEWSDLDISCFELTSGAALHMQYLRYTADDPGVLIQGCENQGITNLNHLEAPLGGVWIYRDGLLLEDLQLYQLWVEGSNVTISRTDCQETLRLTPFWFEPGTLQNCSASRISLYRGDFTLNSTLSDSVNATRCTLEMDSCTVNMLLELNADLASLSLAATDCQLQEIAAIWPVDLELTNCTYSDLWEWMSGGSDFILNSCQGDNIEVESIDELTLDGCSIYEEISLEDDVTATITGSQVNRIHGWGFSGVLTIQDSQLNGLYSRTTSDPNPAQLYINHCIFLLDSEEDEINLGRQLATFQNNTWFDTRPGVQPLFQIDGESVVVLQNNITQGGRYVFEVEPESVIETDYNIFTDYFQFEKPDYQGNYYMTPGANDILQSERVSYTRGETFAHPLPGSPAIDSGIDLFGPDPDGSPPDRGAFPYDHYRDYPPYIMAEEAVEIFWGQDLQLPLRILDDQSAQILLADAPGWLSLDTTSDPDTSFLVGLVPQDSDSTTILLLGEDGINTADSLFLELQVLPYTIIGGEMSGVLSVANSPYYLSQDLVVPEGETLIVEPGVDVQVKYCPDYEAQLAISVFGNLVVQGSEGDTIRFRKPDWETGTVMSSWWKGIQVVGTEIAPIRHTEISNAWFGLNLIGSNAHVSHSRITNYLGILAEDSSSVTIDTTCFYSDDNNEFIYDGGVENRSCSNMQINGSEFYSKGGSGFRAHTNVYNTRFFETTIDAGSLSQDTVFAVVDSCTFNTSEHIPRKCIQANIADILVRNVSIDDYDYGLYLSSSYNHLIQNAIITQCLYGMYSRNNDDHEAELQNCDFYENNTALEITDEIDVSVRNSILRNNELAVDGNDSCNISLTYNDFWGNDTLFMSVDSTYGIVEYVNANGDSCDAYGNLFLDPLIGFDEEHPFRLASDSPCINAGDPADQYFDLDGSINDIGALGGPHGIFPTYVESVVDTSSTAPLTFFLGQSYPNPCNDAMVIPFSLPYLSNVKIVVYNILGQRVQVLTDQRFEPGHYRINVDLAGYSSGLYFYTMKSGAFRDSRKFTIVR